MRVVLASYCAVFEFSEKEIVCDGATDFYQNENPTDFLSVGFLLSEFF